MNWSAFFVRVGDSAGRTKRRIDADWLALLRATVVGMVALLGPGMPAQAANEYFVAPLTNYPFTATAQAGMGADAAGNLFWANGDLIYRWPAGYSAEPAYFAGHTAPTQIPVVNRLVVSASGAIYFTGQDHTVGRITPAGGVSILAGISGQSGYRDGVAASALFNNPRGLAVDAAGNVFVADTTNFVIRRISVDGEVSTLAGRQGWEGTADGLGATARFGSSLGALAFGPSGDLFVGESYRIRRITPGGEVSTFAGATTSGFADGVGAAARFSGIVDLAFGPDGNLHVFDSTNRRVRRVAMDGTVTTVAGNPTATQGNQNGPGSQVQFWFPQAMAWLPDGSLALNDAYFRRALPAGGDYAPFITKHPADVAGVLGGTATLSITAYGSPGLVISWQRNGATIVGASSPTLTLNNLQAGDATTYTATATNALGSVTSTAATLTVAVAPANNAFASRAALATTPAVARVAWMGATREAGEPALTGAGSGGSLWWTWTAPANGFISVDATTSAGSPLLRIYTGSALNALAEVPAAAAYSSTDGPRRLTFAATAGTVYQIALESPVPPVTGEARLSLGYTYMVTGVAGDSSNWNGQGAADGTGAAASFNYPVGMVRDSSGNFFVTDTFNHTIRRITPAAVVTTVAGTAGQTGTTDGTGAAARFNQPQGLAIDAANNLYTADSSSHTIRRITPAGVVTTFAGGAGVAGAVNATGTAARFNFPVAVVADGSGNVFVADAQNHLIRRITSAGVVTTLAGTAGTAGSADGIGTAATFNLPVGLALSGTTLYVFDSNTALLRAVNVATGAVTTVAGSTDGLPYSVRGMVVDGTGHLYLTYSNYDSALYRVSPTGVVARIAGTSGDNIYRDGDGLLARFRESTAIALDVDGSFLFTSYGTIRRARTTSQAIAPVLMESPQSLTVAAGTPVSLVTRAFGGPTLNFSWTKNGAPFAGGTNGRLNFPATTVGDSGAYVATASNPSGSVTSAAAVLTVVSLPANDAFASATVIPGQASASVTGYNFSATREASEPVQQVNAASGRSVWWRWTAPADGQVVVDTGGSEVRNLLNAYAGTTLAGLMPLQAALSSVNTTARLYLNVVGGSTYHFQVDAMKENNLPVSGYLRLNLTYAHTVARYAGGTNLSGSTDGDLDTARFSTPVGLARDAAGNLVMTEGRVIRRITAAGQVTTLAGSSSLSGTVDATGTAARFTSAENVALDDDGNAYVTEYQTHVIRKITPAGEVTTLAGTAGQSGAVDGIGPAARFNNPRGLTFANGALYVADYGNEVIRRVTLAGEVTMLAGTAGQGGAVDGSGAAARFWGPWDLTVAPDGHLYLTEAGNRLVRRITLPAAVVTTIAGGSTISTSIDLDGIGAGVRFQFPQGIAADEAGNLYLVERGMRTLKRIAPDGHVVTIAGQTNTASNVPAIDGTGPAAQLSSPYDLVAARGGVLYLADSAGRTIRRIVSSSVAQPPAVTTVPANQTVLAGANVTFTVGYFGTPEPSFTWRRGTTIVATTAGPTLTLPAVQAGDAGAYTVELTNTAGSSTSAAFTLTVTPQAANDAFANRATLTGLSPAATGNNLLATSEAGEPVHFEAGANRSVWWTWTAPADGYYVVHTAGSTFATLIGVYTGPSVGALTQVGEGGATATFFAAAGTTYQIAIDGRSGATGTIALRLVPAYFATTVATGFQPLGVALDPNGDALVTAGDHAIRRVTAAGVVTIIAGAAGTPGSADGTGAAARFNSPWGIARDSAGNLYVSDSLNHTIRRITPAGVVSTLAGAAGLTGTINGTGAVARFNNPTGLTLDAAGTALLVADSANHGIRRLDLATGAVTTFAGTLGSRATASISDNPVGTSARFWAPEDIVLHSDGNYYVADLGLRAIRRITPAAAVTTVAGARTLSGTVDGTSAAVRFLSTYGITSGPDGVLLVADGNAMRQVATTGEAFTVAGIMGVMGNESGPGTEARFQDLRGIVLGSSGFGYLADNGNSRLVRLTSGSAGLAPIITRQPASRAGFEGETVTFMVEAIGMPATFTYQWRRNGTPIGGATSASLTLNGVTAVQAGDYTVVVTNSAGSTPSGTATLTVSPRPANDAFAAALVLSGATPSSALTNAGATREAGEPLISGNPGGASIWWKWVAPSTGVAIADTSGSTIAPLVAVYTGSALGNLVEVARAVPSSVPNARRPAIQFAATAGTTYWIAMDGDFAATGTLSLKLHYTYSFTPFAGLPGTYDTTDGVGGAARFYRPYGLARDSSGNFWVADNSGHTVRRIAPNGTVTTVAGLGATYGAVNGTGSAARFNYPWGLAVDSAGNAYVADSSNHAIRRITSTGVVTTFAGTIGSSGSTNATGAAARFNSPTGVAIDTAGNFYVSDYSNHVVRKITPAGVVTTLAGLAGTSGLADGTGAAARFNAPQGIAVDSAGNVYVAEPFNQAVRKITPAGVVTTLLTGYRMRTVAVDASGSLLLADYNSLYELRGETDLRLLAGDGTSAIASGVGLEARFTGIYGIVSLGGGVLMLGGGEDRAVHRAIITTAPSAPSFSQQPLSVRVIAGTTVTLTGQAAGNPSPTYQWRKGVTNVDGATGTSLTLSAAQPSDSGSYTLVATNAQGATLSVAATVEILPLPVNDAFNRRSRLLGSDLSLGSYNYAAAAEAGEPAHGGAAASRSVWFTWTAPANGDVFIDTIGSAFDTRLAVYRGDTLAGLTLMAENTSAPGAKFSKVRLAVAAGEVFQIAIDGAAGATGDFRLTLGYNYAFQHYAGTINTPGSANGALLASSFNGPVAMASDAGGNVYIADVTNHVIRRITPAGVVSTFAGTAGVAGNTNGVGAAARFNGPYGVTADKLGNLFVTDTNNHTVRKIVISTATVSTLAGTAGTSGTTDGTGAAARFNTPVGIAADASNNLYVSDYNNRTVRKVTQAGVVTTFAGTPATVGNAARYFNTPWGLAVDAAGNVYVADSADIRKVAPDGTASYFVGNPNGSTGYADGVGTAARFNGPAQLAIDPSGNLYVADQLNHVIRQVSPAGEVRTIGGHPGEAAHLNGTADDAYFAHPTGILMDQGGYLYVGSPSMQIVVIGLRQVGPRAPMITTQPDDQSVVAGGTASFVVVSAGHPAPTYQWRKNGANVGGATGPVLTLAAITAADAASYDVVITNAGGTVTSRAATLTLATPPANDNFASAASLTGPNALALAFPTAATAEGGEPAHAGVAATRTLWWNWTAPSGGAVIVQTTGSAVDTRLAVYTGTTVAALGLVAANDDTTSGGASRVQFTAVAGTTYRIAVDASGAGAGQVRVALDYALVATTLAGSPGNAGTTDATGGAARFGNPWGLARDSLGNVYVADTANHTIRKITPGGVVTTLAGSPGQSGSTNGTGVAARFNSPTGLAIDQVGNLFVADLGNHTIRKVTAAGDTTTYAGAAGVAGSTDGAAASARFNSPVDVVVGTTINGGGTVYVADFGNNTLRKITTAGVVTTLAGTAGQAGFADGTGAAARFDGPRGPAVDSAENIYLADFRNHTLRKITPTGVVTTVAGFPGSLGTTDGARSEARLSNPTSVTFNAEGRIFVTQLGGESVRQFSADGVVTTVAGGVIAGHQDGTAFDAGFDNPIGITSGPDGALFVTDYESFTVRRLARADLVAVGQTITFAALSDRPFTPTPFTLSATASSGLAVTFTVVSGPATVTGNSLTLTGTGVVTVRASQAGNSSYTAAPVVDRSFTVMAGFASWRAGKFTSAELLNANISGPNAVFGADGLPNLIKYALGLEPKQNITTGLPVTSVVGSDWTYTYTRPSDRTELTYTVEVSTNLSTWTTAGVTHEQVSSAGGTETWRARYPLASAANAFFRLKVVTP